VALVVVSVAGFCLFEGDLDGDHHAGSFHVCLAMAVSGLMPASVAALLVAGTALSLTALRAPAVALGVALPPPKSLRPR
jgi:hypothetical protein